MTSDVFVDHLRGHRPLALDGERAFYSVVTRAELFAGRQTDEALVSRLLESFGEVPVERSIAELAGRLRRRHAISLPDALIAATALQRDLAVVSRNRRDFDRVPGLAIDASR